MIDIYEVCLDQKETIVSPVTRYPSLLRWPESSRSSQLEKGSKGLLWLINSRGLVKKCRGVVAEGYQNSLINFAKNFGKSWEKFYSMWRLKESFLPQEVIPSYLRWFLSPPPSLFCGRNDTVESLCPCLIWQNSVVWTGCCDRNKRLRDRLFVLDIRLSCRGGRRSGSRVLLKGMVRKTLTRILGHRRMERVQSILMWKWLGQMYGR